MRETLIRKATALGDVARDIRMWPAARAMYGLALSCDPSLAHIWVQYGRALKKTGRIGPSEDAYRRSLALLPDFADTHLQLGHLLFRQGKLAEAEAAYVTADRLDPKLDGVFGSLQRVRQAMREAALAQRSQDSPEEQRRYQIGKPSLAPWACATPPARVARQVRC
jgi:cytochrome c-type biogenesis protein CcmH/NrfG